MEKLTNEKILKFKDHFNEIFDSLDAMINRVVYVKSTYGQYSFNFDYITWEYDGEKFEVEATENGYGCCGSETHYASVSWDDLLTIDSLEEKLKKEAEERKKEEEKKKRMEKAQQKRRKEEAERKRYEELKAKYEKS